MQTVGLVFATSAVATWAAALFLERAAARLQFYTLPNERSTHQRPVPPIGGIAFAVGMFAALAAWAPVSVPVVGSLAAVVILGWLDDWRHLLPKQKLMGQLFVAGLLVGWGEVRIEHLEGILGIGALTTEQSIALSTIGAVGIINAFNLIDGIDGLAGALGLWTCAAFGLWMYGAEQLEWALFAAGLSGGLCTFLYFNWAPARIFMGDAGSMLLGAAATVLAFAFLKSNRHLPDAHPWHIAAGPAVAVAVLFVPLFDLIRVFALRIGQGRSPFRADRSHVHHELIASGLSHMQATGALVLICIGVSLCVWYLQSWGNLLLLIGQGLLALVGAYGLKSIQGNRRFKAST